MFPAEGDFKRCLGSRLRRERTRIKWSVTSVVGSFCQGHTHMYADTTDVSLDADGGTQYPDACAISYQVMLVHCHHSVFVYVGICYFECSAHPIAKLKRTFRFECIQGQVFLPITLWFCFFPSVYILSFLPPPSTHFSSSSSLHTSVMFSLADLEKWELTQLATLDKLSLSVCLPLSLPHSNRETSHTLSVSNWPPAASDPKRSHAQHTAFLKLSSVFLLNHFSFDLSFVLFFPALSSFSISLLFVFTLRLWDCFKFSSFNTL